MRIVVSTCLLCKDEVRAGCGAAPEGASVIFGARGTAFAAGTEAGVQEKSLEKVKCKDEVALLIMPRRCNNNVMREG